MGLPHMIQGLVHLLLFQALGELLCRFIAPSVPGPVLGLVLLLIFLIARKRVPPSIDTASGALLSHLGLLFIPASVGVVLYVPVLRAHAWAVGTALVVSVVLTLGVTAGLLRVL
jgi:putative effector of murein hydrolase LrgA (UPF0299 family)